MSKKKKKAVKQEIKQEKVEVKKEEPKKHLIGIDVFFSIEKVKEYHKEGMRMYKGAKEKKMTIEEWREFFSKY